MSDLIKKSIRLPADIVDYVEAQPGRDFTSKLLGLLMECRDTESQRAESLAYYERSIADNTAKIKEQQNTIYGVTRVLVHLQKALDEINNLSFT